ncbi:MAG: hypothetical protein J4F45_11280 [Pseudomonadales bacterium]|nr:hypothetical protein [Pseudomonadales bacterium]
MRIEQIRTFTFPVPFKVVFRHASATRSRTENVIVAALGGGETGFGEGCPRSYVTGETVAGAVDFLEAHADGIMAAVDDLPSLRAWIASHRESIDRNPAAFCALETAILDLFGRIARQPVEELLGLPRLEGTFTYSAVLGDAPQLAYLWQLGRYRRRGFTDFKVKLAGDPQRDRRKFAALAGTASRVRLDANNLWTSVDTCIRHLSDLPGAPFAVEEPLAIGDLDGFRAVGEACGMRIVLDESLLRAEQVDALECPDRWIVNLRVSKMGGVLRSLELVERAARRGLGVIVGCQVGETSVLTRAALPVMQAVRPNLVAAEGAFGTYLLRRDLTTPSLMFDAGGILNPAVVPLGNGFGLSIRTTDLVETSP